MHENKKDKEATKLARKTNRFSDPKSWISNAGHQYLAGEDLAIIRRKVLIASKFRCAICKEFCSSIDADMDHIKGGTKFSRCECWNTPLADGTVHTNLQIVHGMMSIHPCHRVKHHREVWGQWA